MAKELPYFKFNVSEWILGRISDEDDKTQGAFIVAICHYWHKQCDYLCIDFERKIGKKRYNLLKSKKYFTELNNKIRIDFLDEQFTELFDLQAKRSESGKKGRAAQLGQTPSKNQANAGHLDKDEDEEEKSNKKDFSEKIIELGKYVFKDKFSVERAVTTYSTSLNNLKESFLNFLMSEKYHEKELNDLAMDKMSKHFFRWLSTHQPKKAEHKHSDLLQGEWGVDFHLKPTPIDEEELQQLLNDGYTRTKEGMVKRIKPIL